MAGQASLVVRSHGQARISDRPLRELQPYMAQWLWEGPYRTELRGTNHRKTLGHGAWVLLAEVFLVRAVPDLPFLPEPCHGNKEHHSPKQNKRENNLKGNLCYFLSPVFCLSLRSHRDHWDHMQSVNKTRRMGSCHRGGSRKAGASMAWFLPGLSLTLRGWHSCLGPVPRWAPWGSRIIALKRFRA